MVLIVCPGPSFELIRVLIPKGSDGLIFPFQAEFRNG